MNPSTGTLVHIQLFFVLSACKARLSLAFALAAVSSFVHMAVFVPVLVCFFSGKSRGKTFKFGGLPIFRLSHGCGKVGFRANVFHTKGIL